jgi:N-acetylneuraminate lyase
MTREVQINMWLTGITPAFLTPFDKDGEINYPMVREMVEFHIANGVAAEYVGGSTGEGFLLTEEERCKLAETAIDQVKGRIPVIIQVGSLTTAEASRLAAHAQAAGADAISSVPPFYFRVGFDGVKEHYAAITAACDLPMYIYNIPGATGVNVTPELCAEIVVQSPRVVGMKFTSYNFFEMRQLIDLDINGKKLNIVSGPDEMMVAAMAMGAHGAIGSTYNVLPKLFVDAYDAFNAGDVDRASELQGMGNRAIEAFLSFQSISALKEMMTLIGFDCGSGRRPQRPLSGEEKGLLKERLEQIGFFDFAITR